MNLGIDQLNHVALHVSDLDASVKFYRNTLGLAPKKRPDFKFQGAWFALGPEQELHLIAGRAPDDPARNGNNHAAFRVKDFAAAEKALRDEGIVFRGPGQRPDGAHQIFLDDPDGHTIELTGDLPEE